VAAAELGAEDLALLLVSAARLGLPGWSTSRGPSADPVNVAVLWTVQQRDLQEAEAEAEERDEAAAAAGGRSGSYSE
jgi:hypothetical protein